MKYLIALLILTFLLSGCATSLYSLAEGIRIPFVSDSIDHKSSAATRDNKRGDTQASPDKTKSPSSNAVLPVQASAEATDQLDQF